MATTGLFDKSGDFARLLNILGLIVCRLTDLTVFHGSANGSAIKRYSVATCTYVPMVLHVHCSAHNSRVFTISGHEPRTTVKEQSTD